MLKKCNKCGKEKDLKSFASKRGKPNSRCKECIGAYMKSHYLKHREREIKKRREWYARNPEKACAAVRKNYHENKDRIRIETACRRRGITVEQYNKMVKDQNGLCANCNEQNFGEKRLAIDHDHKTGNVRALLCDNCNTALGLLKEDQKRIFNLISYINKYQK